MKGDVEIQYNNRARIAETPAILKKWRDDADAYRAERSQAGKAELDVAYGSSPRQIIDIFSPDDDGSECITVFIHGGYWQLFEPALFSHLARGANERGLVMAMIGYDLCPDVSLEQIVGQMRAACAFLWRRYRRRLVLSGHSAGGHLTAAMLTTDWSAEGIDISNPIAAGLAISGVFELAPLLDTSMNGKLKLNQNTAKALSPVYWQPRHAARIDAWVGGSESEEFLRQSREFVEAWRKAGADAHYEIVPDANHFTVIAPLADAQSHMTRRLHELARGPR